MIYFQCSISPELNRGLRTSFPARRSIFTLISRFCSNYCGYLVPSEFHVRCDFIHWRNRWAIRIKNDAANYHIAMHEPRLGRGRIHSGNLAEWMWNIIVDHRHKTYIYGLARMMYIWIWTKFFMVDGVLAVCTDHQPFIINCHFG